MTSETSMRLFICATGGTSRALLEQIYSKARE
jgi:hypothetical protein